MPDPPSTAVVTGAAGGLGRALALQLAREHYRLALVDADGAGLHQTCEQVQSAGGHARAEVFDVRDDRCWADLRDRLRGEWPHLDLLANNAGVLSAGEVADTPIDEWQRLLDVNLLGVVRGCRTFIGWLQANPRGAHILNTASIAALFAPPATAAYSASKAAVMALSEALYAELRSSGVGVTVLCPSFFMSDLLQEADYSRDAFRDWALAKARASRLTPEKLAAAALRAMRAGKLYAVVPPKANWIWRVKRFHPAWFSRWLSGAFARFKAGAERAEAATHLSPKSPDS